MSRQSFNPSSETATSRERSTNVWLASGVFVFVVHLLLVAARRAADCNVMASDNHLAAHAACFHASFGKRCCCGSRAKSALIGWVHFFHHFAVSCHQHTCCISSQLARWLASARLLCCGAPLQKSMTRCQTDRMHTDGRTVRVSSAWPRRHYSTTVFLGVMP